MSIIELDIVKKKVDDAKPSAKVDFTAERCGAPCVDYGRCMLPRCGGPCGGIEPVEGGASKTGSGTPKILSATPI